MNEGQEQFFDYIMERVQEDKQEEAANLLSESFGKQASGEFTADYLQSFIPRMIEILKPEKVEEVKSIMMNYGPSHTS